MKMKVLLMLSMLAGLLKAGFGDDYSFYKVDKVYGEETYVSKSQIKHYNPELKSYHELNDSGDGMKLNWHTANHQGLYEKGFVNLRYGEHEDEGHDSEDAFGGSVLNRVLKVITILSIIVSALSTFCLFSAMKKVKDIEHG